LRRDSYRAIGERNFGHEKGAFTGAISEIERLELADKGRRFPLLEAMLEFGL
jgi:hypothetical protein